MPASCALASASAICTPIAKGLCDPEALGRNDLIERSPFRVFHHDEVDARIRTDVVDGDDVRMVERARRLCFLHEALLPLRIGYLVARQHLDGHHAIEMCVAGFVDHTHPALAQLRFDSVAIERLTDHRKARMSRSILGVVPVLGIVDKRFDARLRISIRRRTNLLDSCTFNSTIVSWNGAAPKPRDSVRSCIGVRTMDPDHRRSDP